MENNRSKKERIYFLDEIRGFAILCMVVHHSLYDVGYLLNMDWGYDAFDALRVVQPVFWVIFIVTSGICTNLSRNSTKRGCKLLGISLGITFVTAVIMPAIGFEGQEIYFGIIHCLAVCMIIAGLAKKITQKINVKMFMALFLVLFAFTYWLQNGFLGFGPFKIALPDALTSLGFLFPLGITDSTFVSADYFPLFPWLFMFLFGVLLGRVLVERGFPRYMKKSRSSFLQLAGRNSLWIYVFHQPVLYAVFFVISLLIP